MGRVKYFKWDFGITWENIVIYSDWAAQGSFLGAAVI